MTLYPMTRQDVPPLLTLSGAVLEAQWDRVGHITSSDRCRRPVGREKKKKPRCLIFGTRTIAFRIAEAISRGPLIGPCDGSMTRFTANSSTWLQRVRHVCNIDCQFLLGRGGGNVRKSCRAWQWSYSNVLLGVVVIKRCAF